MLLSRYPEYRRTVIISAGVAIALLAVVLIWFERGQFSGSPAVGDSTPSSPATSTENGSGDLTESLPPYKGEPISGLAADPEFLKQVPPDRYQKSLSELADLERELTEDPGEVALWMQVAYIKRYYDDDIGARDAYEYLNVIAPFDPVPYYNVAVIYGYSLKDSDRAIEKYRTAIARDPQKASFYVGFSDFYRDVKQDLRAAEVILLDGQKRIPEDPAILVSLGLIYRLAGDTAKAIAAYERAYELTQGAAERAAIQAELERLRAGN